MSELIEKPSHYFHAPRKEMLEFIPSNACNILEIGCGEGFFTQNLKRIRESEGKVITVTAVEIDPIRAERAKEKLDHVICANIEDENFFNNVNLSEESYDCIICNDVLEHLISPWLVLEKLKNLLTEDGVIVASIPNVRYWGVVKNLLFKGDWHYTGEGVLDITHLRFFTRNSIRRLFTDTGYEVISLVGINSLVRGWKFSAFNFITFNYFQDIQYWQFAIVAKNRKL